MAKKDKTIFWIIALGGGAALWYYLSKQSVSVTTTTTPTTVIPQTSIPATTAPPVTSVIPPVISTGSQSVTPPAITRMPMQSAWNDPANANMVNYLTGWLTTACAGWQNTFAQIEQTISQTDLSNFYSMVDYWNRGAAIPATLLAWWAGFSQSYGLADARGRAIC